jgi:hypothetical protein
MQGAFDPLTTYKAEQLIVTGAQGLVPDANAKGKLGRSLGGAANNAESGKNRNAGLDRNMVPTWSDSIAGTAFGNVSHKASDLKSAVTPHAKGAGWGMAGGGLAEGALAGVALATGAAEVAGVMIAVTWVGGQIWGYTVGQAADYTWGRYHQELHPLDATAQFSQQEFDDFGDQLDEDHIKKMGTRLKFIEEQLTKVDDYLAKLALRGAPLRCGQPFDLYRGVTYIKNQHAVAYKELSYLSLYVQSKLEWLRSQVAKLNDARDAAARGMAARANANGWFDHSTCDPRKCVNRF